MSRQGPECIPGSFHRMYMSRAPHRQNYILFLFVAIFRETPGDYDFPWHNTPSRQFVIILKGEVDFTVSDGETRRFGSGAVVLLEDTSGKGHFSKAVKGQRRKSIFVTLD